MTVLHSGSTKKFAAGWESIFDKKKAGAKKTSAGNAAARQTGAKAKKKGATPAKKANAKKKSKRS